MFASKRIIALFFFVLAVVPTAASASAQGISARPWLDKSLSPDIRAELIQAQMTREEELKLVSGYFGVYNPRVPVQYRNDMPNGAGYVPGIPRLGIPALKESDASLGVANGGHMRKGDTAVALPSSLATAATWNPSLAFQGGAMIGEETRRKGFNVLLAGGINLTREPRSGRTFEYSGEDPWLASVMVGESIRGIQSRHVISTIKHFALNDQETGRMSMSADISESAMRESDLLAFELAIERSDPGSVMCSYNRINGVYGCENDFLLNRVLKGDWGYRGFVMSDWGAVHSTVAAANNGLDQQSSRFSDSQEYFGTPLAAALADGSVPEARLRDMVHRILRTIFAKGIFDRPIVRRPLDVDADLAVAQRDAEEAIVLLKNDKNFLPLDPLSKGGRRILVIGGFADVGVLSGGGSSQVIPIGFKELMEVLTGGALKRVPGEAPRAPKGAIVFHPPAPLAELRKAAQAKAPTARVVFYDGGNVKKAAAFARANDVVIIFAQQWMQEARDNASLSLAGNQDALIDAVARANPKTVVVLQTGGPVAMPWLGKVAAVLEAWYSGNRGATAIARVLLGQVNPSGHLPVTFPRSERQLPHPAIAGFRDMPWQTQWRDGLTQFDVKYSEGPNLGYKWFAQKKIPPLFSFGHGLSYTSFAYGNLDVSGGRTVKAAFDMTNTGKHAGKAVGQIYVLPPGGTMRLVGWIKQPLKPGETKRVSVIADRRLLARFDAEMRQWHIAPGDYLVMLGASSTDIASVKAVHIDEATIKP
jgi:beta-glucosidase